MDLFNNEKKFLWILFGLSFLLRFFYVLTLKQQFYFDDSIQWDAMAQNFLAGKGLIISGSQLAYRMPFYPIFLSVVYFFCGYNFLAVYIFQSIISALTCILVYFIGKEVFQARAGKIASVLCMIYPFFIYYNGAILSETLYTFLLAVMILFLLKGNFLCAGFFLGISTLTRAEIAGFILFIFIGIFFIFGGVRRGTMGMKLDWGRKALRKCLGLFVIFLIVLLPWVVRNYFIFHKFVPLSTQGGLSLYAGNNPLNTSGGGISGRDYVTPGFNSKMSEIEIDQSLKQEAISFIKRYPLRCLRLYGKKFLRFWNIKLNTDDSRYASRRNNIISMLSFGPVLILFLISLFLSLLNIHRGSQRKLIFLYLLIIYVMITNFVLVPSLRFRLPIEPYIIVLASYPLSIIFRGKEREK